MLCLFTLFVNTVIIQGHLHDYEFVAICWRLLTFLSNSGIYHVIEVYHNPKSSGATVSDMNGIAS